MMEEKLMFNLSPERRQALQQDNLEVRHALTKGQRKVVALPVGAARELRLRELRQWRLVAVRVWETPSPAA
jgi:hypothetical protein